MSMTDSIYNQKNKVYCDYSSLYNEVMKLYDEYNLFEIKEKLSLSENVYRRVKKNYNLTHNKKFVKPSSYGIISFCKKVLNKSYGITYSDVESVKRIIEHHLYEECLSPHDISIMYELDNYKNGDFINFLKNCLKVNTKSLKEAQKSFHTKKGTYDNLSEKELYYNKCQFRFGFTIPQIQGYELIKKYGIYSNDNITGVARDHIVSISYGWENNISPEIISHPANCQIVQQIDNCRKSSGSSISVEELKERIRLWEEGLPLPEVSIIGIGNRTKIHTKALTNSLKEHYKN